MNATTVAVDLAKNRRHAMTQAYQQFCAELSAVLYEEDPGGFGRSVGAPLDEYASSAARLAVALKDAADGHDIAMRLHETVGTSTDQLIERVAAALSKFRNRCEPRS